MSWLKDTVRSLKKPAGGTHARQDKSMGLRSELLNLAMPRFNHMGFVHLPSLWFTGRINSELPSGDPLK